MKTSFLVIGAIAILSGAVWMGQGSGYFPYPRSSFMINETPWIYYGAGLAVAGILLIVYSRR